MRVRVISANLLPTLYRHVSQPAMYKRFLLFLSVLSVSSGCRSPSDAAGQEQGAMVHWGEDLAGVTNAAQGPGSLAGRWVLTCLPAPVPDHQICLSTGSPKHEDSYKAKQSALEKPREMPGLPLSSFSPPCKLEVRVV